MAVPTEEDLHKMKLFLSFCTEKPDILHLPQLDFFKKFIEKLGGKIPPMSHRKPEPPKPKETEKPDNIKTENIDDDAELVESDVELDMEGCVEPDMDAPLQMGDDTKEPTEEDLDQASEMRSKGAAAYSEQKYDEAIGFYTEAIKLNPLNALFYAKRGQALCKQNKPNACIRDCNRALVINCDSAAAYKYRGRANRLLGHFELAVKDLRQACKLDYDEETDEWFKELNPNVRKLELHRIKYERLKSERDIHDRQERVRKAKEANKKASEENVGKEEHQAAGDEPFMHGLDKDFFDTVRDPEVMAAMMDIMNNPSNIVKYLSNPKIMKVVAKCKDSTGGMPGFAGGMPGGMPGMPGGMPGGMSGGMPSGFGAPPPPSDTTAPPPKMPSKPDLHDDGLD